MFTATTALAGQPPSGAAIGGRKALMLSAALFVAPAFFYFSTMAPSMGVGDSAMLLESIAELHLTSHVNNHPFTVVCGWVVGKLLPFDDLAMRGDSH